MGHNVLESDNSKESSSKTLVSELSKNIVSESFNEIFKQATGQKEAIPGDLDQADLEKLLTGKNKSDADKSQPHGDSHGHKHSGKHDKHDSIDVGTDGLYKGFGSAVMEDLIKDVLKSMADSKAAEDRQHKIAEKAMKDPTVQQVREVHTNSAIHELLKPQL